LEKDDLAAFAALLGARLYAHKLMNLFENIEDEIEDDFYCWEKGTYRFDVWHWFDERLPNGIAEWTVG